MYINNVTKNQINTLINGLEIYPFFLGYTDTTFSSTFKDYISLQLANICIKNSDNIILPHEDDQDDDENMNLCGYAFEENGFKIKSISDSHFGAFLSYKIENRFPDKKDVSFSVNAILPMFKDLDECQLIIEENKKEYLLNSKTGIMKKLELYNCSTAELKRKIFDKISNNYIYNLEYLKEFNTAKFNISLEFSTSHGKARAIAALEYLQDGCSLRLITLI